LYAYFRRLAPGKYQLPCTIKIQRKDGKEVVVHFESNLVLEDNEEGFRSVLTDVTDLIGAEEALKRANDQLEYKVSERTKDLAASKYQLSEKAAQLERSNDELQQFAYIASHDLQEPLRMVISYLTLLERKYESQLDDTAREYLHYAVMGGERMRGLIDDLLEYSSVEAKGVRFECVDMKAVVSRTIELLVLPIEENQAEINVFPLPAVIADQSQMVQVMQNLISNAIKFHGSERPIVTISSTRGPDEWIFSVKDNGIGLNMHYADRIFQVFQRLNNRDRFEGTGIGLAIVKKILERHGGRVWVESEEGKGAAFYFTIPLKP
jgi:light-regulated signal transduction histidine kinase (bacteriophytochrome)